MIPSNQAMIERRNGMRIEIDTDISYSIVGHHKDFKGRTINLSSHGILFIAPSEITPGNLVEISITPQNTISPPLDATIEVVRSTNQKADSQFQIAGIIKQILPI